MSLAVKDRVAILSHEPPSAWSQRAAALVKRLDSLGWKEAHVFRVSALNRIDKLMVEKVAVLAELKKRADEAEGLK